MEHLTHFEKLFSGIRSVNELIEYLLLAVKEGSLNREGSYQSTSVAAHPPDHPLAAGDVCNDDSMSRKCSSSNQGTDSTLSDNQRETSFDYDAEEPMKYKSADWARMLNAVTQRRTEVLTPENLENMWTKGRNYKKKENKKSKLVFQDSIGKGSGINGVSSKGPGKELLVGRPEISTGTDEIAIKKLNLGPSTHDTFREETKTGKDFSRGPNKELCLEGGQIVDELGHSSSLTIGENKIRLKRSNSTSALVAQPDMEKKCTGEHGGPIISEFYGPNFARNSAEYSGRSASDVVLQTKAQQVPKLKCRVSIVCCK